MNNKEQKVSIIIPAYNEEDIIGETLSALDFPWLKEIIVIDDGSKDNTSFVAQKKGARVISLGENRGKGSAVTEGIRHCKSNIIGLIDADLGKSSREIKKLVDPILQKEIDVAIGIIKIKGGGLGIVRGLANNGLKLFTGKEMEAPLSGQRVLRKSLLDKLLPLSSNFGLEIGMDIEILKNSYSYREIECDFRHRITGHSFRGYLHRFQQFLSILKTLWQKRRKSELVKRNWIN